MAVEFAGAYKYTYTNSGTKIQKKFYVSKKIDENLPNFYILYGKWMRRSTKNRIISETINKTHRRQSNCRMKGRRLLMDVRIQCGRNRRTTATIERMQKRRQLDACNTKKSTGGAPARAGRCRQLDDVIRRRDTEKRIVGN